MSCPSSACQFTIAEVTPDTTGPEAIVTVGVLPAKYLDKTGTTISGLGGEAYDEGPYVEVRIGAVSLQPNENSGASKDLIVAMYRADGPPPALATRAASGDRQAHGRQAWLTVS